MDARVFFFSYTLAPLARNHGSIKLVCDGVTYEEVLCSHILL